MSNHPISLDVVCKSCGGTGLYVGLAERDGAAVVCTTCTGSGKAVYQYQPFQGRMAAPSSVTSVHVGRGYVLGADPRCDGGVPIGDYEPGMVVPADEQLYCPYLYTSQAWCARPEVLYPGSAPSAPLMLGSRISECKHWDDKAECWRRFHAEAPSEAKGQTS
jgi:hypothetical protein